MTEITPEFLRSQCCNVPVPADLLLDIARQSHFSLAETYYALAVIDKTETQPIYWLCHDMAEDDPAIDGMVFHVVADIGYTGFTLCVDANAPHAMATDLRVIEHELIAALQRLARTFRDGEARDVFLTDPPLVALRTDVSSDEFEAALSRAVELCPPPFASVANITDYLLAVGTVELANEAEQLPAVNYADKVCRLLDTQAT